MKRYYWAIALMLFIGVGMSSQTIPVQAQAGGALLNPAQQQQLNLSQQQRQSLLRLTLKTNDRIMAILEPSQRRAFRTAIRQGKTTEEAMKGMNLRPAQKVELAKVMQLTQQEMLQIFTPEQVQILKQQRSQ
ncbi:hypothetical protein L3556_11410 [Candidatus Synechococcus calcipolaris G9]|uniref:P pilus assembly/Cpx signaling pathway, periplasmic inhibitor/zinc-resistance associated protein n=1 Tax=Candidatus Synechococcus calcipolaris G9 TaxID=1497997 RepID=A0ABT6F126_9SYNE|nr:hypothetical protein [Candidatus Synechococcus calcipolaris]MDG2991532.1 hypothetical protein [Candidatus Synechococcus calcipolaris G9]